MAERKNMWDDETDLRALNIHVPWFVRFDIVDGAEVQRELTPYDVAAIEQGQCDSGAWMPACTYYTAKRNLCENSREVYDYLGDGCVPYSGVSESWGQAACDIVSQAVEKWAGAVARELRADHGYE